MGFPAHMHLKSAQAKTFLNQNTQTMSTKNDYEYTLFRQHDIFLKTLHINNINTSFI